MYKIFTEEKIIEGLKRLTVELGHEPTSKEIDKCSYLPSARQIQRAYGGLPTIRQKAGLVIYNHTEGETRRKTANIAQDRADVYESDIIKRLVEIHHDHENWNVRVEREFAYQHYMEGEGWYKNISCDVAISDRINKHVILIDFFYPEDMASFSGCVNVKQRKLEKFPVSLIKPCTHTNVFVCVNNSIGQEEINKKMQNKKNKTDITVLSYSEFEKKYLTTQPLDKQ